MSDEILPKSRTELDKQSFTRDANGKIARRVTDEGSASQLDDIKSLLTQIENNTDELEITAESINLNTDELEDKLDTLNSTVQTESDQTQVKLDTINTTIQTEFDQTQTVITNRTQKTQLTDGTNDLTFKNTTIALNDYGVPTRNIPFEPQTYSAAVSSLTFDSNPTDIFTITGSADKTIRLLSIKFSATKNTAANLAIVIAKRSTANTGGTSTTLTNVPHDSTNAAGTATVRAYTLNPTTLGTLVGYVYSTRYYFSSGTGLGFGQIEAELHNEHSQPLTLRGANELLSINLLGTGTTVVGNLTEITVTWVEV